MGWFLSFGRVGDTWVFIGLEWPDVRFHGAWVCRDAKELLDGILWW